MYLTASGAPNQMERGKSAMMTALGLLPTGIVLALVAYGVVELVMPHPCTLRAFNRTRALVTMRTEALPPRNRDRSRTRSSSANSTTYFALPMSGCPPSNSFTIQASQILKLPPRYIRTSWTDY